MSFNFYNSIIESVKSAKLFIQNYINTMDYEFMRTISKTEINKVTKANFYQLGFEDFFYQARDGLNKKAVYYIFEFPCIITEDLLIEILDEKYFVVDDDNRK